MLLSLAIALLILLDLVVVEARRSCSRFTVAGDAFRCRFRACGPSRIWRGLSGRCGSRWSRRMWAMWAGDMLIVRRGPLLPRILLLRAGVCGGGVYRVPPDDLARRERNAVAVVLQLGDGSWVEMAAGVDDGLTMVGPYLAAATTRYGPARSGGSGRIH